MTKQAPASPRNGWPDLLQLGEGGPSLIGGHCVECGYVSFPPLAVCPRCLREATMRRGPLSKVGRLENFTVVHQAPKGFTAPYIQAFVRLPEGVLVFTHVAGCAPRDDALQPCDAMRLSTGVIKHDANGAPLLGYVFERVPGGCEDA